MAHGESPIKATHADLQKARELWTIVQEEYIADAERAIALALAAERAAAVKPYLKLADEFDAESAAIAPAWPHILPVQAIADRLRRASEDGQR